MRKCVQAVNVDAGITQMLIALASNHNYRHTNATKELSEAQNASKKLEKRVKELEAIVADRDICALGVCVCACVCIKAPKGILQEHQLSGPDPAAMHDCSCFYAGRNCRGQARIA